MAGTADAPVAAAAPTPSARNRRRFIGGAEYSIGRRRGRRPSPTYVWPLLDDLVGPLPQRLGNLEPQQPGGLQVDDELESIDLLDGQIGRTGAQQHALDVLGGQVA